MTLQDELRKIKESAEISIRVARTHEIQGGWVIELEQKLKLLRVIEKLIEQRESWMQAYNDNNDMGPWLQENRDRENKELAELIK